MTKTPAPTVRNVNAALRDAGIRVYAKPKTQRNHRGETVQSCGYSGTRVAKLSPTEVRVSPEVHVSTAASTEARQTARDRAYAAAVAALAGFTCQFSPNLHSIIVTQGA